MRLGVEVCDVVVKDKTQAGGGILDAGAERRALKERLYSTYKATSHQHYTVLTRFHPTLAK